MTDQISPPQQTHSSAQKLWLLLATVVALWAGTILKLATEGVFDLPPSDPALPTLIAILAPVAIFMATYLATPVFRDLVLSADPVLLTELQAWRILGGTFLVVMAFGHLPGSFAWPAGLGDLAVGVAAPFMAYQLRKNPAFLTSGRYRGFIFVGLADFAVAITLGVGARNPESGLAGEVTSIAMGQLPLVLIPTFIVPVFIILHLMVLLQVRERKSGAHLTN